MWNIWKTPRLYERDILVAWLWFDSRLLLCRLMKKCYPAYWIWQQFYDWLKRNSSAQRLQDEWTNLELRNCETTLPSLFEELTPRLGFFFMLQNPRSSYFNHFGLKNFAVFKSTKLYSIWWLTKHFIQGGFFNWSARFSVPKWKNLLCQRGAFLHWKFREKLVLVGCNLFFILVLKIGRTS